MIPETLKIELQHRIAQAITNREAAVDVMKELQRHYGWLSDEAVGEAAVLLGLSPLEVEELATFYEMIYRHPVGRFVLHVCDSISCWSVGSETLLQSLEKLLGIKTGETTQDGAVTLLPCCCLGNCGEGPTLMVADKLYNRVTAELAAEIVRELQRQDIP